MKMSGESDRTIRRHKKAKRDLEVQGFLSLPEFFKWKSIIARWEEEEEEEEVMLIQAPEEEVKAMPIQEPEEEATEDKVMPIHTPKEEVTEDE